MLALGSGDSIAGQATSATTVNCTIMGVTTSTANPPVAAAYDVLYHAQLAAAMATLYSSTGVETLISSIHLYNTSATTSQVVTLAINGTASTDTAFTLTIPASGSATYEDGAGWTVYAASGLIVGASGAPGGVGTPATAAQSLTASAANLITGTSVPLATNQLVVGSRFRFELVVTKTGAGTATWGVAVKFGTNNTTADAAIASWTSGTNTALIDKACLAIEVVIASLGAAATANCIAMYVNSATTVTGLGDITIAPTSTATFNSTVTSPFLHVDITPGASAVMTAAGSAERLV